MIFDIQYKEPKVYDGYAIAGEILCGPDIIERIKDVVKFTYTNHLPQQVADALLRHRQEMMSDKVPVKKWWYWRKTTIETTFKNDRSIYINSNGASSRRVETYIQNAGHSIGHLIGYGHGTNYPPGSWKGWLLGDREDKNMSVPHWLGQAVLQLAKEKGMIR